MGVKKVEELRRDLRIKSQELEAKNAAANDKLKKMFKDQQEAEKKKVHTWGGVLRLRLSRKNENYYIDNNKTISSNTDKVVHEFFIQHLKI